MVSFVSIILNLFRRNKPIYVCRLPRGKVLRAHQLGLTLALLFALLAICLNFTTHFASLPWYISPLFVLVFALGTVWSGPFVLLVGLLLLLPHQLGDVWAAFYLMAQWYLWSYAFGAILAILYNDLVFLHLITFCKDRIKVAFVFDPKKKFNIIKSPLEYEQHELMRTLDPDRKLYHYQLDKPPEHPYTIAFVANPQIRRVDKSAGDEVYYETDPIIHNRDLFLRSVDKALYSFERDEVVGRPEIWSRIRVIAIFDESLADLEGAECALVQPYENLPKIDGVVAENLLDPMKQMWDNYQHIVRDLKDVAGLSQEKLETILKETDVIYALSASEDFDRSTAHYSDWVEPEADADPVDPNREPDGEPFEFDPDPEDTKQGKIKFPACPSDEESLFISTHEFYAKNPGRVALNVLKDREKTYLHEFGHAMSSAFRGAIVDEYFDTFVLENDTGQSQTNSEKKNQDDKRTGNNELPPAQAPFYVNRIERRKLEDGKVVGVHKIFARYNRCLFHSDLEHPSAEEQWLGYFPDRKTPYAACTMDRTYGDFRFDELISNFMYDRLIVKINRPDRT